MKKMIILCTVIALLFSMTCISASAEETEETEKSVFPYGDSRDVPDSFIEEWIPGIDRLTGEETVTVLRIYVRDVVYQIACYNNMEEAFAKYKKWDFFVNITKSGKAYIHAVNPDGGYKAPDNFSTSSAAIQEYQTQEALKAISSDIVVENMYYIDSPDRNGAGIYYKTNMGNYVFYDDNRSSRIFSEEAFFAFAKAWSQEVYDKYEGKEIGYASPKLDSLDLSAYDYKSPNFNPNAPFPGTENTANQIWLWVGIGAGVLLLAGGAAFYFIKRKKATVAE